MKKKYDIPSANAFQLNLNHKSRMNKGRMGPTNIWSTIQNQTRAVEQMHNVYYTLAVKIKYISYAKYENENLEIKTCLLTLMVFVFLFVFAQYFYSNYISEEKKVFLLSRVLR